MLGGSKPEGEKPAPRRRSAVRPPEKNPAALISYHLGYIALMVGLGAVVWMVALFLRAEARGGAEEETIDRMRLILKVGLGLGALLGLAGYVLGVIGFQTQRRAKGQAHATIGRVLGLINFVVQIVALILILWYLNRQFPQ